jgi:HEAT repeats
MRYWLTSLTIPAFVVVCAMIGCTTEAKPEAKEIAARQPAATKSVVKPVVSGDLKSPKATEPAPKGDIVFPEPEPMEQIAKNVEPTDVGAKEPAFVQTTEPKKGKDTKTPPKETKDSTTTPDPKKEPPEPTEYMGKSFSQWLSKIRDADPTHREEAMKAVLMFGPNKSADAIPEILTQLEKHKKTDIGVDLAVRVNGIMALSTIFRGGKNAPDGDNLKRAYPLYKQFLHDDQIIMKVRALQGLPYLGPKAADAINDVIELVHYKGTWEVRKEAIQTLTILAPAQDGKSAPNKNAMIALRLHTKKENESSYLVRMAAFQGLAMVAQTSVPPELYNDALYDPEYKVRLSGLNAIGTVARVLDSKNQLKAKDKEKVIEKIEEFIVAVEKSKDKDRILRIWAYATIMTIKQECGKAHLGPVVKFLNDPDPAVRMQGLTVIGMCGDKAKPLAFKAVLALIHDENLAVAGAAMGALVQMQAVEAVDELKKIGKDEKANAVRRDTALDAIDALEHHLKVINEKKEKDKKSPDKK